MAAALEQILGYVNLLGLIERIKRGVPQPLPDAFLNTIKPTIGDSGKYTRVFGTRTTARRVEYGSPSIRRQLKGVEDVPVKLLHTYEHIDLNPLVLRQLRAYEKYERDMGKQEVARQTKEFVQNFINLRTMSWQHVLSRGAIYFDESGNLLPSSSGAAVTVDYAVPANNKNQLNGLIDQSWADNSTNIPAQIAALQERSAQDTGYEIECAFYGRNVPSYLSQNDYVAEYNARNKEVQEEFLFGNGKKLGGSIPQGYLGIKHWIPVNTGFYEDASGTNQTAFGENQVSFTPAPSEEWHELIEGTYEVPTTINIQTDAAAALGSLKTTQGMFAYSQLITDPITIRMFHGDTFLPVLKVPGCVYLATVAGY